MYLTISQQHGYQVFLKYDVYFSCDFSLMIFNGIIS